MAWEKITWACEHQGEMQLYGKNSARNSRAAYEAGRKCMVCWLIDQWNQKADPRAQRDDCFSLATAIAKGKSVRFRDTDQFND